MNWILLEIAPFLVGACVVGVAAAYLAWRRGREVIAAADWNDLQERAHNATQNAEQLTTQCHDLTVDLEKANEVTESLRAELSSAQENTALTEARVDEIQHARNDAIEQVQQLSDEQEETRRALAAASLELAQTRTSLESQVVELELRADVSVAELAALRDEAVSTRASVESAKMKLDNQQSENARLLLELGGLHATAVELRTRLASSEEQARIDNDARHGAEVALSDANDEIARLRALEVELESVRASVEHTYLRVGELETEAQDASEIARERDEAMSLETQARDELELAHQQLVALDQYRTDAEVMADELRRALIDRNALQAQVSATMSTIDLMRVDMISAHRRLAELEMSSAREYGFDPMYSDADESVVSPVVRPVPEVKPAGTDAWQRPANEDEVTVSETSGDLGQVVD